MIDEVKENVKSEEAEAAGEGRFYERLGWKVLVRQRTGWEWSASPAATVPGSAWGEAMKNFPAPPAPEAK